MSEKAYTFATDIYKSVFKIIMYMRTINIQVPDILEIDTLQLSMVIASRFYEQGKLSLGQAAEMTGLSKRAFAELLGAYNVSIFNYPVAELKHDVDNA